MLPLQVIVHNVGSLLIVVPCVCDTTDGYASTGAEPHLDRFPNGVQIYFGRDWWRLLVPPMMLLCFISREKHFVFWSDWDQIVHISTDILSSFFSWKKCNLWKLLLSCVTLNLPPKRYSHPWNHLSELESCISVKILRVPRFVLVFNPCAPVGKLTIELLFFNSRCWQWGGQVWLLHWWWWWWWLEYLLQKQMVRPTPTMMRRTRRSTPPREA